MKKRRRHANLRMMRLITPLTITCGVIAVGYFFYRAALIALPAAASFEQRVLDSRIGECRHEESADLKDPEPILSAKYQQRIQAQPVAPNIVTNPTLTEVNPETSEPLGYSHDPVAGAYEYLRDVSDKQLFLRTTNRQPNKNLPLWQIDPVAIKSDDTYAYSFSYRSDIPVRVNIEYIENGKAVSRYVTSLKPFSSWQKFTAHFTNSVSASAFRMVLIGEGEGYADSRHVTVHQIPDARVKTGVVSVTFDDGWQSVKDVALPLLDRYGVRTTQYIISEIADHKVAEYMDMDAVLQLRQAGHEIGSHSLLHCNLATLNAELIRANAVQSKATLERRALGPIKSFAYPLGQYNETTQDIVGRHYSLIRTSDFGYNDRYFDETNVRSMGVLSQTSDDEFQAWLDYAKIHRLWVVVVYHRVNETGQYNVTDAQLERQLKMIAKSGLKVMPLGAAADYVRK